MPFAGKTLMERDVAAMCPMATANDGSTPFANRKVEAVAVSGAESHQSVGAYHDNYTVARARFAFLLDPSLLEGFSVAAALDRYAALHRWVGVGATLGFEPDPGEIRESTIEIASRDCGLFEINIPGRDIGTSIEYELRTESLVPDVANRVALANMRAAANLYRQRWSSREFREWQAWVAVLTGWAFYTEAYVWSKVVENTWVATGRYLHKAIRGVANMHWKSGHVFLMGALSVAEDLASLYGIEKGDLWVDPAHQERGVQWRYPPKPTEPGTDADYPKPSNGRSPLTVMIEQKKISESHSLLDAA